MITIRPYEGEDARDLAAVFHSSVRTGARDHYGESERAAWSPSCPSANEWADRLDGLRTLVAEKNGRRIGFMAWNAKGNLDLAFVHPDFMGQGVGDALYAVMLNQTLVDGVRVLNTDASHLAKSFLLRHGWTHLEKQIVRKNGVDLVNHKMGISLT